MQTLIPHVFARCWRPSWRRLPVAVLTVTALTACGSDSNDDSGSAKLSTIQAAVVATAASDYSSGAHSVISPDNPRIVYNNLAPTSSDITVAAFGEYFYRIERFRADNITKFSVFAPATALWQFSTLDAADRDSSNPHDMIFADATRAFVTRYGSTQLWIVDPSATDEAHFKIGAIDLSAYADSDGFPEMETGVIVEDKLFVLLQRIDANLNFEPQEAYLAVFDIYTGEEIDTGGANALGVKGIALPVRNPHKIQYLPQNGQLYVQAIGDWGSKTEGKLRPIGYNGGIVAVNPNTYQNVVVLDDGDETSHPYGQIFDLAVVSPTLGYFVGYHDWFMNTLYRFDPGTGTVDPNPVAGLADIGIGDIALDLNARLWVGNQSQHGITVINTGDDSVADALIDTGLDPLKIAFTRQ